MRPTLKQQAKISARQQISLTPAIRQALWILTLNGAALGDALEREAESNLLLEVIAPPQLNWSTIAEVDTLHSHLLRQLDQEISKSEAIHFAALCIIHALEPNGRLGVPLNDALPEDSYDETIAEKALQLVQTLEPIGVAARDLNECLSIQLRHSTQPETLIKQAMTLLQQPEQIQHGDATDPAAQLLRSLNPYPGEHIGDADPAISAAPDLYLEHSKNAWQVRLNPDLAWGVRLHPDYKKMLEHQSTTPDAKTWVQGQLRRVRLLQQGLRYRSATLLTIAENMFSQQPRFADKGWAELAPMTMRSIADDVNMHVSTVSRAVANKHIRTPHGVLPLKSLFSSSISRRDGGFSSSSQVRVLIAQILRREPRGKRLSDSGIARLLKQRGVLISRRTVTKYRLQLGLPNMHQRADKSKSSTRPYVG